MLSCPNGHGEMQTSEHDRTVQFRGIDLTIRAEVYVCPTCGLEAGTIEQCAVIQDEIIDAYADHWRPSRPTMRPNAYSRMNHGR